MYFDNWTIKQRVCSFFITFYQKEKASSHCDVILIKKATCIQFIIKLKVWILLRIPRRGNKIYYIQHHYQVFILLCYHGKCRRRTGTSFFWGIIKRILSVTLYRLHYLIRISIFLGTFVNDQMEGVVEVWQKIINNVHANELTV